MVTLERRVGIGEEASTFKCTPSEKKVVDLQKATARSDDDDDCGCGHEHDED